MYNAVPTLSHPVADRTSDWPYCNAARRMSSVLKTKTEGSSWNELQWRRRIETFGIDDGPVIAAGPRGEIDAIW